ncbi:hypothetical protein C0J52_18420 [Blattella germanica]|nr:hypothetical protein C0J52_18420 [Blattella germanica]
MNDSIIVADKHYVKGSYVLCEQSHRSMKEQLKVLTKANIQDFGIDQQVLSCLLENNLLVLKSLVLVKKPGNFELWNDIMQSFIQLNYEYASLQKLNIVPLKYYLNLVHNTLWWGWCYPYAFQSDKCHIDMCISLSIDCFRRVLETLKDEYVSSCYTNNEELLLYIMKRISDRILLINGEDMSCLIDVFTIVMLIYLELKVKRDLCIWCIQILTSILSKRNHLLKITAANNVQENKVWKSTYKFGFFEIGSSMERNDIQNTLMVMKICCSTFCILVKDFSKCDQCFESVENDFEASLMYVALLENIPVCVEMKSKYNFLFGLALSKLGRHNEALKEIFKCLSEDVKNKSDSTSLALHYIAKEYEILCKKYRESSHKEDDKETSLYHSFQSCHLDALHHVMRESETGKQNMFLFNFNLRILDVLHSHINISFPEALYLLATTLVEVGDNRAAGEIYVELLSQFPQMPSHNLKTQVPEASIIYHNAIVLFLRCNEIEKAESLCRQAITSYVSKGTGLLSMEDDLVALMLLAQIHDIKKEYILQSETLDRCLRLISNYKMEEECSRKNETVLDHNKDNENDNTCISHLLNNFSAKLHVKKARNYMKRSPSFRNDAFYELKQAVICNPGDEDVKKAYLLLLNEPQECGLTQHVNVSNVPQEAHNIACTIENCFRKCGYADNNEVPNVSVVNESVEEDVSVVSESVEDVREDWIQLGTSTAGMDFDTYVSVETSENGGKEGADDDDEEAESETLPVPSFRDALNGFETMRAFIYAHDITERDQINIVNIESLLFGLKRKGANKQMKIRQTTIQSSKITELSEHTESQDIALCNVGGSCTSDFGPSDAVLQVGTGCTFTSLGGFLVMSLSVGCGAVVVL